MSSTNFLITENTFEFKRKDMYAETDNPYETAENLELIRQNNLDENIIKNIWRKISLCANVTNYNTAKFTTIIILCMIPLLPIIELMDSGKVTIEFMIIGPSVFLLFAAVFYLSVMWIHYIIAVKRTRILLKFENKKYSGLKIDIDIKLTIKLNVTPGYQVLPNEESNNQPNLEYIIQPILSQVQTDYTGRLYEFNRIVSTNFNENVNDINSKFYEIRADIFKKRVKFILIITIIMIILFIPVLMVPLLLKVWENTGLFILFLLGVIAWIALTVYLICFYKSRMDSEIGIKTAEHAKKYKSEGILVEFQVISFSNLTLLIFDRSIEGIDDKDLTLRALDKKFK